MSNGQYPKSNGGLWDNRHKNAPNHPDWKGHVVVTREQIRMLIAMIDNGMEAKLQLSAWKRQAQSGQRYISIEGETYMQGGQQPQQGYQQPMSQRPPQQPPQQQGSGWDDQYEPAGPDEGDGGDPWNTGGQGGPAW